MHTCGMIYSHSSLFLSISIRVQTHTFIFGAYIRLIEEKCIVIKNT